MNIVIDSKFWNS